jgi:hypothetical protein
MATSKRTSSRTPKAKAKATSASTKAKPRRAGAKKPKSRTSKSAVAKPKTRKIAAAPKKKVRPKRRTQPKVKAKAPARAKAPVKAKAPVVKKRPPRRNATGRLDPAYARDLRAMSRDNRDNDDDRAFLEAPRSGDDLAEELGEAAVVTMTSGEDQSDRQTDEVEEERGGPFVKTRGGEEFARGTDGSNPRDATREPFPKT